MEKNFLKHLLVVSIVLISCKGKKLNSFQVISNSVWAKTYAGNREDSVLIISTYKVTANYKHYWVKIKKKPYQVQANMETSIELVDDRTIYFNKLQKVSDDYKYLIKKGIVTLDKSTWIDDSIDGYMYIFKNDNELEFRKVKLVDYFETLHSKTIISEPKNDKEQEKLFDLVSDIFWQH